MPQYPLTHVHLGSGFNESEVESVLRTYKLRAARVPDVERLTGALLTDGAIVGWFQDGWSLSTRSGQPLDPG